MNWEMVGAIGEIAGAIGVIVTLGYLSVQMRANTQALRLESEREAYDGSRILLTHLSADAELARIMRIGIDGLEDLDPDERMRFGTYMLSMTYQWLRVHSLVREGAVEADLAIAVDRSRRDTVSTLGYRQWFERRKHWFPDEFRSIIEDEMASTPTDSALLRADLEEVSHTGTEDQAAI